jgi:hypothetical protein
MTPRYVPDRDRPVNRLTADNTLERARLELKYKVKGLDQYERHRRTLLLGSDPARDLSPGARAATSQGFIRLAVKAAKTSENAQLSLDQDVTLAQLDSGAEVKALITGLSDTSAGSFVTRRTVTDHGKARSATQAQLHPGGRGGLARTPSVEAMPPLRVMMLSRTRPRLDPGGWLGSPAETPS